jgi:hypothetical protein
MEANVDVRNQFILFRPYLDVRAFSPQWVLFLCKYTFRSTFLAPPPPSTRQW